MFFLIGEPFYAFARMFAHGKFAKKDDNFEQASLPTTVTEQDKKEEAPAAESHANESLAHAAWHNVAGKAVGVTNALAGTLAIEEPKEYVDHRSKAQARLEEALASKEYMLLNEDFVTMTVLCYLKDNIRKFMIVPEKRAQMLWSALTVQFIVVCMLTCMLIAILQNEQGKYTNEFSHSFAVFYIKFPCCIALHLSLYPEVAKGMEIMKFTNQQCDLFEGNGSQIGFMLGFIQVASAIFCEIVNIYLLTYQHTVEHCIIHFVALEVIMEISKMYLESLQGNALKAVLHHPPQRKFNGRDIEFSKRSFFHQCARIIYQLTRTIYVGVIFYYVPFIVVYW